MKSRFVLRLVSVAVILFIALTGFTYYHKPYWAIWQRISANELISYCELGNYPERYDGRLIKVKAPIAGEKEQNYFLYNLDCDFGIEANMTRLQFDAAFAPDPSLKQWLEALLQGQTFNEKKGHQAILTGWFDGRFSNGCWTPKYAMRVIKVEPIS